MAVRVPMPGSSALYAVAKIASFEVVDIPLIKYIASKKNLLLCQQVWQLWVKLKKRWKPLGHRVMTTSAF